MRKQVEIKHTSSYLCRDLTVGALTFDRGTHYHFAYEAGANWSAVYVDFQTHGHMAPTVGAWVDRRELLAASTER